MCLGVQSMGMNRFSSTWLMFSHTAYPYIPLSRGLGEKIILLHLSDGLSVPKNFLQHY